MNITFDDRGLASTDVANNQHLEQVLLQINVLRAVYLRKMVNIMIIYKEREREREREKKNKQEGKGVTEMALDVR